MTNKREAGERFTLARWSQRKLESAKQGVAPAEAATKVSSAGASHAPTSPEVSPPQAAAAAATQARAPVELPPVESLTFESDFTAFLRAGVDPDVKRAALKQLFRDPRFNVMDGLDVYIDDYTKSDPIPSDMLAELMKRFDFSQPAPEPAIAADSEVQSAAVVSPVAPVTAQPTEDARTPEASAAGAERASESAREIAHPTPHQAAPSTGAREPATRAEQPLSTGPGEATGR